jgi:hypothetical protein
MQGWPKIENGSSDELNALEGFSPQVSNELRLWLTDKTTLIAHLNRVKAQGNPIHTQWLKYINTSESNFQTFRAALIEAIKGASKTEESAGEVLNQISTDFQDSSISPK